MYFAKLYDDNLPFFEQNIDLKKMKPFNELYDMGEEGDKIMACIYRVYDLKSSFYHAIEKEEDRIKDVFDTYIGEDFDIKPYLKHIDKFKDVCRSDLQKKLEIFKQDLEGREMFFRSLSWSDPEDRYEKDQMLISHDKLIMKYDEISKLVESEMEDLESLGGYRRSYIETLSLEAKRDQV